MDHSKYAQTWATLDTEREAEIRARQDAEWAVEYRNTNRVILLLVTFAIILTAILWHII